MFKLTLDGITWIDIIRFYYCFFFRISWKLIDYRCIELIADSIKTIHQECWHLTDVSISCVQVQSAVKSDYVE